MYGFVNWYITEKTHKNVWIPKVNRHQELYEVARIGKTIQMWRFGVVQSQFILQISQKSSFVFGKQFLYFHPYLGCRIFGQAFINPGL
jgi:hypothetical protein